MLSREKEIKYFTNDSQILIFIDPFFFQFTVLQILIKKLLIKATFQVPKKFHGQDVPSLEFWRWISLFYKVQVQPYDLDMTLCYEIFTSINFLCINSEWKIHMTMGRVTNDLCVLSLSQHRASYHNPLSLPLSVTYISVLK